MRLKTQPQVGKARPHVRGQVSTRVGNARENSMYNAPLSAAFTLWYLDCARMSVSQDECAHQHGLHTNKRAARPPPIDLGGTHTNSSNASDCAGSSACTQKSRSTGTAHERGSKRISEARTHGGVARIYAACVSGHVSQSQSPRSHATIHSTFNMVSPPTSAHQ